MKQAIVSKTRRGILLGRTSGQAAVEYILMIAIAVSVVFILKGAFKGFSDFINNYLGTYTKCLMEYGELPVLGVTNDDLKKHQSDGKKCETGFKKFTLTEGRPPVDSSSSTGTIRSGTSKEDKSDSGTPGASGGSRSSKKDAIPRERGAAAASPYESGDISRRGRGTSDGAGSTNNKVSLIDEELGSRADRREQRQSRTIYRVNDRYRALTGQQAEQLEYKSVRSSIKRVPTRRSIAKASDEGSERGPRTGPPKFAPERPKAIEEVADSGWGFGKMLKWLLIIGMLVAIIIFFGGQLMNYSNSDS